MAYDLVQLNCIRLFKSYVLSIFQVYEKSERVQNEFLLLSCMKIGRIAFTNTRRFA